MGIKSMQGVAAHIEYIKRNPEEVKFINCKFWKNEICYNTLSTKYGGLCYSKRGCMYSIPLPKQERGNNRKKINKSLTGKNISLNLNIRSTFDVINKYFKEDINTEIKFENKIYKIVTKYNQSKNKLEVFIYDALPSKKVKFSYELSLNNIINVIGNEVIFKVKIDSIVKGLINKNSKLAKLIKEKNNDKDIVRKAVRNDNEIINSRDSLIKYTSFLIVREIERS